MHLREFKEVQSTSRNENLTRWATILGFVGMLRPHTFAQIKVKSFVLVIVTKEEKILRLALEDGGDLLRRRKRSDILGYYIEFKSKTMPVARAYFPNLSTPGSHYSAMCPVRAIQNLAYKGWLRDKFVRTLVRSSKVNHFLQKLTEAKKPVPFYSLRIGGRTWNISKGLDRQFVDYLGTWKSPEASARYYRETPSAVLKMLRNFYARLPDPKSMLQDVTGKD